MKDTWFDRRRKALRSQTVSTTGMRSPVPTGHTVSTGGPPWVPGQPVFKYVDLVHASFIEIGSIKVGTLRSFSTLESSRADPDEGRITYNSNELRSGDSDFNAAAARCGFHVENSIGVVIQDVKTTWITPNHYCFCTSYRGDLPDIDCQQAVFEIKDAIAFASRLASIITNIGLATIEPVYYDNRERDARQPLAMGPAFLKPYSFSSEYEVRFVFEGPAAENAAPIITAADAKLAGLMRRIR